MRISDWSSDVCSSDLDEGAFNALMALYEVEVIGNADGLVGFISKTEFGTIPTREHENSGEDPICILDELVEHLADGHICVVMEVGSEKSCYVTGKIGRASCRERVCQDV